MKNCNFEFRLILVVAMFGAAEATLKYYGNAAKQRQSTINSDMAEPGSRMWVDDPLDGLSRPGWGYLSHFQVYIDAGAKELPHLQLQIWTTVENQLRKYGLKASIPLVNYQPGKLYAVPSPLNSLGYPLEVTPNDRLGFTHSANFTPISLSQEVDDQSTATTAHRTYYYRLEWNNNQPPTLRAFYRFGNDALRAVFSIGVFLNNDPPISRTERYIGAELRSSEETFQSTKAVVLRTYKLMRGRMTSIFLRFNSTVTTQAAVDVLLWRPVAINKYELVYLERVISSFSMNNPYVKVELKNQTTVDESMYLGFRLPNASALCYRINLEVENYFLVDTDKPLLAGSVYVVDNLRQYHDFSTGVIVEVDSNETEIRQLSRQSNSKSSTDRKTTFLSTLVILLAIVNRSDS